MLLLFGEKMNLLSEQDEEFLWAIGSLSEEKKNIIIAYLKDKLEAAHPKKKGDD